MVGGPGLRNRALRELDGPRLEVLLAEQESLFVEHKANIAKGEGFQLAKAAASFANTMGGWILVGVTGGKVDSTWAAPSGEFVDTIRQRLQGQVDPLPSFAARVLEHQANKVGVVRVYESTDTPHILSDGSIVVREPAQDAKLRKRGRYEANPIRSHYELLQLAQRGEQARHKAEVRFEEGSHPLIEQMLDLRFTSAASSSATWRTIHVHEPALILRLAPLTVTRRWMEWAVSKGTVDKLSALTATLAGPSASVRNVAPHPRGFGVTAVSGEPLA